MVALVRTSGGQFCGGTLVASKYVISAAHCLKYNIPSEIKAGLLFLK